MHKSGKRVSKNVEVLAMYADIAEKFAKECRRVGMSPDAVVEGISGDPSLLRVMVHAVVGQKIRRSTEHFSMLPEPDGRMYHFEDREGGQLIDVVEFRFPQAEDELMNLLPGICGDIPLEYAYAPPDGTPERREFGIFRVLRTMRRSEFVRMTRRKRWQQAYLYDLLHISEWNVPHPLFVLDEMYIESCPYVLPEGVIGLADREWAIMPDDRVLVWRPSEAVA